jgi:hypothetical protein
VKFIGCHNGRCCSRESEAHKGLDLRRDKPGARMPKAAKRVIVIGVIAGLRGRLVARNGNRINVCWSGEAQGVLPECGEIAEPGIEERRRPRPREPQQQSHKAE